MEAAPTGKTVTSEKTGYQVEICKESPENAILKNTTVLRWGKQTKKDMITDIVFLADQIYVVIDKLNQKNMPYNF